ncbi:hypothetical protein ACS0TY_020347 [Phlomoides rotata]
MSEKEALFLMKKTILVAIAGADPDIYVYGSSALTHTAERKTNCIKTMLEKGADVNLLSVRMQLCDKWRDDM